MDVLRLLRNFEAVYRLSSFSSAADELGLTHSAITKNIKTLEAEWGTLLFHRTTRNVVATEAAKKLYPRAVDLLADVASVRDSVMADEHEINIISGPMVIEEMVHPAIIKFAHRHPNVRINVMTMPPHIAAEELLQRRAHLLIYDTSSLAGLPHRDRMREISVIDEPYWMISRLGHPVESRPQTLEELVGYDWALAGYDRQFENSLPEEFSKLFRDNGIPKYRLLSKVACVELVKQSDLLTAAPRTAAQALAASGQVSAMPLPEQFRFSIIAAVLQDAPREPSVEHFIECL